MKNRTALAFIYTFFKPWNFVKLISGSWLQKWLKSNARPAQLRKLKGPNYQHKFLAGRKSLFHFDVEISL